MSLGDRAQNNYADQTEPFATIKANKAELSWSLGYYPTLEEIISHMPATVLNFGCGPGTLQLELTQAGIKVTGVDRNHDMLAIARQRDPDGEYLSGLADLPEDRQFDCACASFCFCEIPDDELLLILIGIRQRIRSGGKLVILEPNLERAHGVKYSTLHYHVKSGVRSGERVAVTLNVGKEKVVLDNDVYRLHVDYRRLLRHAGFKVEKMRAPKTLSNHHPDLAQVRRYPPFLIITAS